MIESNMIICVLVGVLKILTGSRADEVSQEFAFHRSLVRWLRIPDIMCMARVIFVGSVRGLAKGGPVYPIMKNQHFKIPLRCEFIGQRAPLQRGQNIKPNSRAT